MTQALLPHVPSQPGPDGRARRLGVPTGLSLHGTDSDGLPATWHVTAVSEGGADGAYLVERALGEIHSPALWMQAQRDAALAGEADVLALVRRVLFGKA